jgi:formate-dependent nitrite reductase membrane component NrfD
VRFLAPRQEEVQESYYGLPAVKPGHYRWPIVGYFFAGGLGAAAQFIATLLDLLGRDEDRAAVRAGRYAALLGAIISPVLLIVDLGSPRRWFNMLRIFRPTSPMSIGTWALTTFGISSGLTVAGQMLEDLFQVRAGRLLARLFSLPAALSGGVVALYSGTLLDATSTPFWTGAYPWLSSLFASSAVSTATATLALATSTDKRSDGTRHRLRWLSLVAGAAEMLFASLIARNWRRRQVGTPIREEPLASTWRFGVLGLGMVVPFVLHLVDLVRGGGRSKARHTLPLVRRARWHPQATLLAASIATLAGGFALRTVLVLGGPRSARHPEDYLRSSRGRR